MVRALPSAALLRDLMSYNPETGSFIWNNGCRHRGKVAGNRTSQGYWVISIDGRQYAAHRLAWVHFYGAEPIGHLDHVNCDRSDNRIANLREAGFAANNANRRANRNNSHGTKGVTQDKRTGRWIAQIKHNYRNHYLGSFETPEEANQAYFAKAQQLFGEFARAS